MKTRKAKGGLGIIRKDHWGLESGKKWEAVVGPKAGQNECRKTMGRSALAGLESRGSLGGQWNVVPVLLEGGGIKRSTRNIKKKTNDRGGRYNQGRDQ